MRDRCNASIRSLWPPWDALSPPHRTVAARPIGALGVERGLGGLRSRERAWRYLEAGLTLGMVAVVAHVTVPWERGLP